LGSDKLQSRSHTITTNRFEVHAKTAEKIDVEKCNFRNFGSSVTLTLTLTLDRVEVRSHWYTYVVEVYPHTKLDGNRKNFLWMYGWTDKPEF